MLAEQLNTTPWDVRKNITRWDIDRISAMNKSKNKAVVLRDAMNKVRSLAAGSLNN